MKRIGLPVKQFKGDGWGEISALAPSLTHHIVGETVHCAEQNFSFIGGHRVRLYKFKKNVHFKIPEGVTLDIAEVPASEAPRRQR